MQTTSTESIIGTGGTASQVSVSSESIKTCIEPTGQKWGDSYWYNVFVQGNHVHTIAGYSRAQGYMIALAKNRGVDINKAISDYYSAFAAELAAKKAAAVTTPVALIETLAEPEVETPSYYQPDEKAFSKARAAFWKEANMQGRGRGSVEHPNQRASRLAACAAWCGKDSIETISELTPAEVESCAAAIRTGELTWQVFKKVAA